MWQFMHYVKTSFPISIFLDSSNAREVCSSQDTSCSQQTISSGQHPSCFSDVTSGSSSKQSAVHEVIDLSQYNTPSTSPDSVQLSGLQIYKADVQTVQPEEMITDTVVLFLFL